MDATPPKSLEEQVLDRAYSWASLIVESRDEANLPCEVVVGALQVRGIMKDMDARNVQLLSSMVQAAYLNPGMDEQALVENVAVPWIAASIAGDQKRRKVWRWTWLSLAALLAAFAIYTVW